MLYIDFFVFEDMIQCSSSIVVEIVITVGEVAAVRDVEIVIVFVLGRFCLNCMSYCENN